MKDHSRPATAPWKPRVGVVGLALPGFNLGEKMCAPKLKEMVASLPRETMQVVCVPRPILTEADARRAGNELTNARVDCILATITTFIPDQFIVELLGACNAPVFLWAVERELQCISVVCGPLITASLYELKKSYRLAGADISDAPTLEEFGVFARAAMLKRVLRNLRVGYAGGKPSIMLSMSVDEYALKRTMGVTTVTIPIEDLHRRAAALRAAPVHKCWCGIRRCAGSVCVSEKDAMESSRYFLAARQLCEEMKLEALSLNCFPHLKSRICLTVARLNDDGIASACEGDLHSTILMHLLGGLTGRPAFNGDFLRMYPESNEVLFSHCGAGAFSLAASRRSIRLQSSIETRDGLAVCYPTQMDGPVTLLNLIGMCDTLRLAVMEGDGVPTDVEYEGTPLRVRFAEPVHGLLQGIARTGAGHHWNGGAGHLTREFSTLCEFSGLRFNNLTPSAPPPTS